MGAWKELVVDVGAHCTVAVGTFLPSKPTDTKYVFGELRRVPERQNRSGNGQCDKRRRLFATSNKPLSTQPWNCHWIVSCFDSLNVS